jgi:tripartite-type tricarboxylate transporter receptor subunit TctC
MMIKRALLAVLIAGGAFCGAAQAQDYPTKPINLVVPFTAGGASDTLGRMLGESMSKRLGQRILIQNIEGAGGTLGSEQVVKAEPDGYTLLLHHIGMSTAPTLYKNLPFDPLKDLEPIGLVADATMIIVGRKDLPPNTLAELIQYVKDKGDEVTYAFAGTGSATHLCGMLFKQATGTAPNMVPYKGSGPALADVMGGHVDFICELTTGTVAPVKAGDFKGYALTAPKRLASLPDLPTVDEAGLPNLHVSAWYGLYAPAKTPKPVIEKLSGALADALRDPELAEQLGRIETTLMPPELATPEAHRERLASQIEKWRPILQSAAK